LQQIEKQLLIALPSHTQIPFIAFSIIKKAVKQSPSKTFDEHLKKLEEEIDNYNKLENEFGEKVTTASYLKLSELPSLTFISSNVNQSILEKIKGSLTIFARLEQLEIDIGYNWLKINKIKCVIVCKKYILAKIVREPKNRAMPQF
jgi:hypothetical protein